ncbi:hypothetical protein TVAG_026160 [Trichomonas vaginalis G3]|uniref:Uncharacterized protein n=1 Tax=Trichomonas vaginalis (strain ATCC PRA-98 / G3) TaxID=412133 RepID=A2DZ19_TRIV3|nr:hypothetical protein TVAGG3_0504580 [Trichomonas vaginalis G3]EAY14295.1 hypothetical protein TVAG_026160 [Trichomonas vaginalis G3]KAI5517322.1 hypothetical protein TVAGG3_0504580 [Trichomonas vaginalis G3]|eukprot:XP_001326518.1 hypothetical protein [Trichomonas vaginalis G3]
MSSSQSSSRQTSPSPAKNLPWYKKCCCCKKCNGSCCKWFRANQKLCRGIFIALAIIVISLFIPDETTEAQKQEQKQVENIQAQTIKVPEQKQDQVVTESQGNVESSSIEKAGTPENNNPPEAENLSAGSV